jgi:DNA-directed RNA polymerase subunit RPC12/RpoP
MVRLIRNVFISLLFLLFFLTPTEVHAQEESEGIELRVVRIFGYRLGDTLQGRIGLRVDGPEDLVRVAFYLDDEMIFEDREAPYQYDFSTGEFSPGEHTLQAVGYTKDGRTLHSDVGMYTFLSADQATQGVQHILVPLLIGVIVLIAIAGAISALITKRKVPQHKIGDYGPAGGAVCKRCGKPFSRHIFSPNLVVGKLERCPYCGKVAIVRRGTPKELKEAEARLLAERQEVEGLAEEGEEERLRRMLDESRFEM